MRNIIYRFAIGHSPVHVIEHMNFLRGLKAQVALLRICRQIYHEAIPLVLGLRKLVLGKKKVAGHGKRMTRVLDRMLKCPLSRYIQAMIFMVEKESLVGVAGKLKLCCNLKSIARRFRSLMNLRAVRVVVPKKWGGPKVKALKVQLQQELCEGSGIRAIEVKIGGRHEVW